MSHELDERYFTWLYSQVAPLKVKNPSRTHWSLAKQLFTKEFVWFVPNDDNRVEDGRDLRFEFLHECGIKDVPPDWLGLGCSMLELLIGLSRRLSFNADGESRDWFWQLIENLNLPPCNDRVYNDDLKDEIDQALDSVIWRTYAPNGDGGLFPLREYNQDQRKVELWYQMHAYILAEF